MHITTSVLSLPLDEEDCKRLVFSHWDFLQNLARKRFPHDDNTAHLALDFVLESLQQDGWLRVRTWEGQGRFVTFLGVLAARLMTDYVRKTYGHQRVPKWIQEKKGSLWKEAYQAVIVERYSCREAVHLLQTKHPERREVELDGVISEVIERSPSRYRYQDSHGVSLDDITEPPSPVLSPDAELEFDPRNLSEALAGFIRGEDRLPPQAQHVLEQLRPHLCLDEADRLILRLRFCEGLKISQIAEMLDLKGDPYKRLNKILKKLRIACERAQLTLE